MSLLVVLKSIKDVRGRQGKHYELHHVLYICILALLSGAYSYRKIHSFFLAHFVELKAHLNLTWERVPAHTTLRDIIQKSDKASIEHQFRLYSAGLASDQSGRFICGDGKVLRGSFDHMEDQKAIQLFSIFAANDDLILAHEDIADKTNEIPVFQKLLIDMGLQGKIFTLDALHAQKKH